MGRGSHVLGGPWKSHWLKQTKKQTRKAMKPTSLHSTDTSWVFRTRLIMPMRNSNVNALGVKSWKFFHSFWEKPIGIFVFFGGLCTLQLKNNMAGWNIIIINRRYIFKWLLFIVMLVFGGADLKKTSISFSKTSWSLTLIRHHWAFPENILPTPPSTSGISYLDLLGHDAWKKKKNIWVFPKIMVPPNHPY